MLPEIHYKPKKNKKLETTGGNVLGIGWIEDTKDTPAKREHITRTVYIGWTRRY